MLYPNFERPIPQSNKIGEERQQGKMGVLDLDDKVGHFRGMLFPLCSLVAGQGILLRGAIPS